MDLAKFLPSILYPSINAQNLEEGAKADVVEELVDIFKALLEGYEYRFQELARSEA